MLTHGHEDHVGALPYVLREIGMPPVIYGGPLTIGIVRSKLEEHKLRDAPLEVLDAGERVEAGPFEIEMIHMSHSIPDARAVAVHTDLGTILVTGDYKFDQTPVDGRPADIARLAELGREGVLCLCGDSTNADRPGVGAVGVDRRAGAARGLLALRGPDHRHLLRLQRPPRAAGDRRGRGARPPGRPRRALDAQELQHRLEPRDRQGARGPADLAEGDRGLPRPQGGRDLDRQPGRAALGAAADGVRRPPRRRAALRRHGDLLGDPDPGQRALGQRDDRPHLRDRRPRHHRRRRPDPRLRPRLARGAEADAQPDPAEHVFPFHGDHKRIHLHAELAESVGVDPDAHPQGPQRAAARDRRRRRPSSARASAPG